MDSTSASVHGASDVLRSIPRPEYPIQVFTGAPTVFSLEAQRDVMRWSHERGYFLPDPNWVNGPNIKGIKETVWPFLQRFGCKPDDEISITFLADGGFNRVYSIQTPVRSYVFRVAFPVDPYYKTEADVATSELVRHFTTIPVPKIYAYDSSPHNALDLEWILMDKITSGKNLEDCWKVMDYDTKCHLAESAADWTAQLSEISSSKIGSIYMRYTKDSLDFFVGRCVNNLLTQENRLLYDVPRGPFDCLQDYYAALLSIAELDVRETIRVYLSGTFQFEETSSTFKGTFFERDIFFILGESYDKPDSELMRDRFEELDLLARGLKRLQEVLPELCAKTEDPHTMVTMLAHEDLSPRNIFVDDEGTPVAVLDWENIQLAPLLFLTRVPDFMDSAEDPCEPGLDEVYKPNFTDPEEKAKYVKDYNEWYARHLNDYQCTMLRKLYRETLRSLDSPLSEAVWEEMPEFDRELLEHIHRFSSRAEDHKAWVDSQISVESDAEEPVSTEGDRMGSREEYDSEISGEGHELDDEGV